MANLGERGNVMGPQPIGEPCTIPVAVRDNAAHFLTLLAQRKDAELAAAATASATREVSEVAAAIEPGTCLGHEIIATARVNRHYYVKARLLRPPATPLTVQFRLGQRDGRWMIWEAMNLTGRTAWSH